MPRSSGIILLDYDLAAAAIKDLSPAGPDECAVLCLGHVCPDKATCQEQVRFPALARGDEQGGHVLLAGCLHNLGEKPIRIAAKQVDSVQVEDMVPCSFSAFADEWQDHTQWQSMTASPVKSLAELLKQEGMQHPIRQAWNRIFRWKGKPTTPSKCDFFQFQAFVPSALLETLLRVSGHKGAYVVPRSKEGQILQGWEIVWVSSSKAETLRTRTDSASASHLHCTRLLSKPSSLDRTLYPGLLRSICTD